MSGIDWRMFLPILHIVIEVPFVSIRTMIMHERYMAQEREFVALHIRVWKWHFEFGLYDTARRYWERNPPNVPYF